MCDDCLDWLPWIKNACPQCGAHHATPNSPCGYCTLNTYHFDSVHALFEYEKPISQMMHQLKFKKNLMMANLMGKLWIHSMNDNQLKKPDLIIPVPLHVNRLKKRGYNQALEIIRPVSHFYRIPIDTKACIRIKDTQSQTNLTANKRSRNLRNAFALTKSINEDRVVIFDDVMTTGATVNEIAGLLKTQNIAHIEIWTCARAQPFRKKTIKPDGYIYPL